MTEKFNDTLPTAMGVIPLADKERLDYFAKHRGLKISRLVGIAIQNELKRDSPFEWNCELPDDELIEYAYVDQAGKILRYLKGQKRPTSLELLVLIREDIGVPDRYEFLMAFRDCLERKMIVRHINRIKNIENVMLYLLPENATKERKTARRKASKYERYQKMKKEFGDI